MQSILSQYYEGLEVIVIDDQSTDGTKLYLHELNQYDFIKIIYNKENRGVNYSRNRGIEAATGKFILFLDSDDALVPQSLCRIKKIIEENRETTHFLFVVSDRADSIRNVTGIKHILYQDWINESISGDFTHVVLAYTMKKYLFFESFRMFEHLNWLRVKKETSPQLLIPVVTTQRQRGRSDSLTISGKLTDVSNIKSKFESQKLYYSLYYADLNLYNPGSLSYKLIETILLGVACNQKKECRGLLHYAGKWHIKIAGYMAILLPPSLVEYAITRYSGLK
jgi:glycosyltransferase involved in cell wall biosynthesis